MSELKPLGSEKLTGDDKLKRILELTYYNNNKKINESKAELVKESKNGGVYGIVKEKDAYYVKKGLNESSLDYIGGMYMKNKNRFSSYAEAYKRLEFIKGQEELQEEVKYKLNLPQAAPAQSEAPAAEPTMDTPPASTPDMGGDNSSPEAGTDVGTPEMGDESKPEGDMSSPDMGGDNSGDDQQDDETGKRSDYMSEVQKYAGKLGQELRDLHDKMESDDIKYVLNMIISAVDVDKLSDDDIEEIAKKFDRDGKVGGDDDMESDNNDSEEDSTSDENLGEEEDPMVKLDEFINTPMNTDEIDLGSYVDDMADEPQHMDEKKKPTPERPPLGSHGETHLEEDQFNLDEIKDEIHRTIGQTLSKYFK